MESFSQFGHNSPSTHDEPDIKAKLSGRNFCYEVIISGWDGETIKELTDFETRLALPKKKSCDMSENELILLKEKMRGVVNLGDLAKNAVPESKFILERSGIKVHVIAKKKIDTTVNKDDSSILSFGDIIIADDSGWGIIKTFNDQIWSLYNLVEIGDLIFIEKGTYSKIINDSSSNRITYPYSIDKKLDLEIRCTVLQAKFIIILNKDILRFPNHLLEQRVTNNDSSTINLFKLWKPSELVNHVNGRLENFPNYTQYIDILGIVSYVSRIERVNIKKSYVKTQDSDNLQELKQFICFRWIMIVDEIIKIPIKVKLFLNSRNMMNQPNLTPKAIIVLSNVKFDNLFFSHLTSSQYSTLYLNNEISSNYSDLFPERYSNILLDFKMNFTRNRKDIEWIAGGSLNFEIENTNQINQELKTQKRIKISVIPTAPLGLAQREVRRFIIHGNIIGYYTANQIGQENIVYWKSPSDVRRSMKNDDSLQELWYSFQRRMPPNNFFNQKIERESIYNYYTERFGGILKPLLIPAEDETPFEGTRLLKLKNLQAIDGEIIYYIIISTENGQNLFCFWKSNDPERIKDKLVKLKNEKCIFFIDIFCVNNIKHKETYQIQVLDIITVKK